jgi:hypothetical protein
MHNRRDFIKRVGIAFASLLAVRCVLPGRQDSSPRGRLRGCWLRLDGLAKAAANVDGYERGQRERDRLVADHRDALDELVSGGELAQDVSDQVQTAFTAAAYHVWRANAPITCYEAVMVDYTPASSGQLEQQAAALVEMADDGDLDPDVVARARAAIERDVAFLNLPSAELAALYDEIVSRVESDGVPPFEQIDLEITPEAARAAQFLVELLLASEG